MMTMTMELPLLPTPTNKDDDPAPGSASGNQHAVAEPQRRQLEEAADEVDDDDLNWSSIYEGVLRTRMAEQGRQSALRRAPSMPVERDWQTSKSTPSMGMGMPPASLLRHQIKPPPTATKQIEQRTPGTGSHENESGHGQGQAKGQPRREVVRSSLRASSSQQQPSRGGVLQFQDKKWKSSSDLESNSPRRPYLSSEAWRPALARAQSTAEIKDQLRMWAQAVACNVRQEC